MTIFLVIAFVGVMGCLFPAHYSRTQKARDCWHNGMAAFALLFFIGLVMGGSVGN